MTSASFLLCSLGDLCIRTAFGPRFSSDDYAVDGNIACLRTTDISDDGTIAYSDMPLAALDASRFENHFLSRGDIVVTRTGSFLGRSAVFDEFTVPVVAGAFSIRLVINNELAIPEYIRLFLASPQGQKRIQSIRTGSAQPNINITNLKSIEIPIPSRKRQHEIVNVATTIQHKIDLNRRMNATLEATARALFRSWFVDFDPVRAKLDGRQPPGMDADTAALFPDQFETTKGRLLPKGWTIAPLSEHVDAVRGLSYKGKFLADSSETLLHNLNSVREGGGTKVGGEKWYEGDFKEKHIVEPGDILVANTEQGFDRLLIGYAAMVPLNQRPDSIFSHHLYRVRVQPGSPLRNTYLLQMFNSQQVHDEVSGYANGTTVNMLPLDGLQMPKVLVPSARVCTAFEQRVEPMLRLVEANVEESASLAELRDTLLPKLLSGELTVPEAEEIAEDAA